MRKNVIRLISILILMALISCTNRWDWLETLPKPWTLTEVQISELLPEFQNKYPKFEDRVKALALWRVGTPYEIFKLGEEVEPDLDPIIRLDVLDCTGHVLTTLAFAQSDSWATARNNMIKIHYKANAEGKKTPTYKSRWHYTADRVTANPNTVSIVEELLPADKLATAEVTLNRKEDGSEFLDLGWNRPIKLSYIPNTQINADLLGKIPEVCIVSFVKEKYYKMGIIFAHEGMIIDHKYLIHASQSAGETVKLDFLEYYFPENKPRFDGIVISKFMPLIQDN